MTTPTASPSFPPGYLEEDRGYQIKIVAYIFIALLIISTIMRTCSRAIQKAGFMLSDVLVPLSFLVNLGQCIIALLIVRFGGGKHIEAVRPSDLKPTIIIGYFALPAVYCGAATIPKLAILDLYLNVFIDKFSRYTSYGVGVILILQIVVNLPTIFTQCKPFHQLWAPVPGGSCDNIGLHFTWGSLPNVITDFIMLLLPLPAVWRLQATWRTKLGLALTFLVGSIGLGTSIARFIEFFLDQWYNAHADATWDSVPTVIFTIAEGSVYHLAACFLAFRPLFRWISERQPMYSLWQRSDRGDSCHELRRRREPSVDKSGLDDWSDGTRASKKHKMLHSVATTQSEAGSGENSMIGIQVRHNVEVVESLC